jgi:hypothetical protein
MVADATTAVELLDAVDGGLASVTGDAAYDTVALYEAAGDRGATVVVPPTKTAKVSTEERVRALAIARSGRSRRSDGLDEGRCRVTIGRRVRRTPSSIQTDHRRGASSAESRRTTRRDAARVQRPESDDHTRKATVLSYRSVTRRSVDRCVSVAIHAPTPRGDWRSRSERRRMNRDPTRRVGATLHQRSDPFIHHGTDNMKRVWAVFAAVIIGSYAVLGWTGLRIYQQAPPIPSVVATNDGRVLLTQDDIQAGQNVWQSRGRMELGSIWGHGCCMCSSRRPTRRASS